MPPIRQRVARFPDPDYIYGLDHPRDAKVCQQLCTRAPAQEGHAYSNSSLVDMHTFPTDSHSLPSTVHTSDGFQSRSSSS